MRKQGVCVIAFIPMLCVVNRRATNKDLRSARNRFASCEMDDFGRTHARTHKNMFDDEAALLGLSSLLSTPWMSMGQPEGELNFSHPTKIPSQLIKMPNLVVIAIVLEECKGKTNNGSPCGRVGVKLRKYFVKYNYAQFTHFLSWYCVQFIFYPVRWESEMCCTN